MGFKHRLELEGGEQWGVEDGGKERKESGQWREDGEDRNGELYVMGGKDQVPSVWRS